MSQIQSCEMKRPHFGPKRAISVALTKLKGLLPTKLTGSLLCTPSLSWRCQGGWVKLANLMALPRTKNGSVPLIGILNGFLLFWRQKESPLPSRLAWLWWELDLVISWSLRCPKAWPAAPWYFTNSHGAGFNGDSVSWPHCSRRWTVCS